MNKSVIREKMIDLQHMIIEELEEKMTTVHTNVDLDEEMTHSPEDYAHQYESQELEQLIKVQLNRAKNSLKLLETIDFSARESVTSGAIVETDDCNFLIGFSTIPFNIDQYHLVGISKNSPIYACMANKKVGDRFFHSGKEYKINHIY